MSTLSDQLSHFVQNTEAEGFKKGEVAKHERGVVLRGPWETYADGFNEHVRRNARALQLGGVPVQLRSVSPRIRIPMGEELNIDRDYADLLAPNVAIVTAQIVQVVPHDGSLQAFVQHRYYSIDELRAINSRKVLYTVWERFRGLQDDDRESLNSVGQVWVACHASAAFLAEEGVNDSKIKVLPCPYLPNSPLLGSRAPRKPGKRPTFYHVGKWEPRKEQRNILGAFLLAFKPGECAMMMKTSEKSPFFDGYPPNVVVSMNDWLSHDGVKANGWTKDNIGRDVMVATRRFSEEEMKLLHQHSDCYVTLARGEGFDMPAFDAKLVGNLMLYTGSGGPQDFAHSEDIRVPTTGLVPAHPFYRWHKDAKYIDYELDAAVEGFKAAAKKIREGVSAKGDLSSFSAEEVGKRMAGYLRELGDVGF